MANYQLKKRKGKLFGKPRGQVVKHPGAFRAKAKAAGKSTAEYAKEKASAPGTLGKQARLAKTFSAMRKKK
jgi:hypothetical protein